MVNRTNAHVTTEPAMTRVAKAAAEAESKAKLRRSDTDKVKQNKRKRKAPDFFVAEPSMALQRAKK